MGLCFSKKKQRPPPAPCSDSAKPTDQTKNNKNKKSVAVETEKQRKKTEEAAVAEKKPVFVVKTAAAAAGEEKQRDKKPPETPAKKPQKESAAATAEEAPVRPVVPVRTSSCTKEEVDAILIQCGRLSRSSSGKATSNESGGNGGHRRYSGSKRSYDFDQEKKGEEEEDWEKPAAASSSRPSPRRRTPGRERDRSGERKRSVSRDRSTGGGRRVSRSPGRRPDGPAASSAASSGSERARQPAKMVSVPAREKGSGGERRALSPVASGRRCASPRSHSPARMANENAVAASHQPTPSLSRSSSRKAEQSPYPRNPMAEIDENSLRGCQASAKEGLKKISQKSEQIVSCKVVRERRAEPETGEEASETKGSAKSNATHSVSIVAESLNARTAHGGRSSSRRSSRDFDHNAIAGNPETAAPNANSYASLLLDDIHNYHQHHNAAAPAFSLPACVSKACSILEAVADLNSSSSENKSYELDRSNNDKGSINGRYGKRGSLVVESEVVVKDDLTEPSLHKYVSVRDIRGETEPQESAGSNSFVGQQWTCSWEPNSVDSTDRTWSNGDEVEQESSGLSPFGHPRQLKQKASQEAASSDLDARHGRPRGASSSNVVAAGSSSKKREHSDRGRIGNRGSGGNGSAASGKSGSRVVSLPAAPAWS